MPDRVFVSEQRRRRSLADNENFRRRESVLFHESTPGNDASLIGIEVRRSNTIDDCCRLLAWLRKVANFDDVFADVAPIKEGGEGRNGNGRYSRQGLETFEGEPMKGIDLIGIAVAGSGEYDRSRNQALGFPAAARVT